MVLHLFFSIQNVDNFFQIDFVSIIIKKFNIQCKTCWVVEGYEILLLQVMFLLSADFLLQTQRQLVFQG